MVETNDHDRLVTMEVMLTELHHAVIGNGKRGALGDIQDLQQEQGKQKVKVNGILAAIILLAPVILGAALVHG